jgi:hypothetical protein
MHHHYLQNHLNFKFIYISLSLDNSFNSSKPLNVLFPNTHNLDSEFNFFFWLAPIFNNISVSEVNDNKVKEHHMIVKVTYSSFSIVFFW